MAAWFSLDGVDSRDVGIHVKEYPPRVMPKRLGVTAKMTGAPPMHMWQGAYGYEEMMLTVEIHIDGGAVPEAVAAFLQPEDREIVFGDEAQYRYFGRLEDQLEMDKVMRGRLPRIATLNLKCSPFKQLAYPGGAEEITAPVVLEHPGTARSYPRIRVYGSGEGSIFFRGTDEFAVKNLAAGEALVIDSGAMLCTDAEGKVDRSRDTEGDYPYLDPGENSIRFSGSIERIEIEPNWAWIGR